MTHGRTSYGANHGYTTTRKSGIGAAIYLFYVSGAMHRVVLV